jgi:hypothetical protein
MLFFFFLSLAHAFAPSKVFVADTKKNHFYIQDGVFIGGDRMVSDAAVKSVRRSVNGKAERIVVDIQRLSSSSVLQKVPFFQVALDRMQNRISLTLSGNIQDAFDISPLEQAFRLSKLISQLILVPKMDIQPWTLLYQLESVCEMEVFELIEPSRVVIDLRSASL